MCHVSVGHVQRAIETAGIPTVSVYVEAFAHVARQMSLPRTLTVPHLMGRPLGPPFDRERQADVVMAALDLISSADRPTIVELAT